ncbi:MAG: hypothetical protein IKA76_06565 [Clostridia bacterium]|nr:hypothetical protein [Clostridia bacterium]
MAEDLVRESARRKLRIWIFLGGILGALLLILGSVGIGGREAKETGESVCPDAAEYAERVEEEIRAICSRVRGAGEVSVAVTLKGGYRAVYATDSQSGSSGYKSNTVLIGSGSSEGAVLICYENPEIGGVGIVCRGASDPSVRDSIISLVSAAFDVKTNKIYVATGWES